MQEHSGHLLCRLLTLLLGHVSVSKPGIKYVPLLDTVIWPVDVREKGNEGTSQKA